MFDINVMRGPKYGLDMFRKMHSSMRILVCGGDGTVGWVLHTLDLLGWPAYPPIAVLPLGTGNDLARAMGWGGTFSSDEPLVEVLAAVQTETSVTHLDRWRLDVYPLTSIGGATGGSGVGGGGGGAAENSAIATNNAEMGTTMEGTNDTNNGDVRQQQQDPATQQQTGGVHKNADMAIIG